ncbi:FimV/HubP family polar landmark protein [Pseudomonas sp. MYb118]|uniref:FimV/HubP family polar landmark protein n=1 Tax=Pseudomonas sp. MYb118 TaxID=1848720 RepID=UPI0034CEB214
MLESWHVVRRGCARWLLAGGFLTYSALASALGLGEITVHSALNQPLRADIVLEDAAGLEEGDLAVSLATADEFSRAGVERVFFLNDLKFTPILRGNRSVIRVSSTKVVNEPFLDFLVQLNQPNGRVVREYTVLIDPPGTPGIVPVADEPASHSSNSPFPSVTPAPAPSPAAKKPAAVTQAPPPAPPVVDDSAEQLAASVLQNQQLQKTVDELNARLQAQDEQIAGQKQQITDLETRLAQDKPVPAVPPVEQVPPPVVTPEPEGINWWLVLGLLVLVGLLLVMGFVRRRQQQAQALPVGAPVSPSRREVVLDPAFDSLQQPEMLNPVHEHHEEAPTGDVLEGVSLYLTYGRFAEAAALLRDALAKEPHRTDLAVQLLEVLGKQGDEPAYDAQENSLREAGFDPQQLQDMRARFPKLSQPVAPAAAMAATAAAAAAVPLVTPAFEQREVTAPVEPSADDEFQLNLDELSMDSSWDLVESSPAPTKAEEPPFASNLQVLPFDSPQEPALEESELEWLADPDAQALDDDFLDGFSDENQSIELEPLDLDPAAASNADKLEQAQTCIDDGDLDSAAMLLNELLKDGDEPLRQTARTLLAGIR